MRTLLANDEAVHYATAHDGGVFHRLLEEPSQRRLAPADQRVA